MTLKGESLGFQLFGNILQRVPFKISLNFSDSTPFAMDTPSGFHWGSQRSAKGYPIDFIEFLRILYHLQGVPLRIWVAPSHILEGGDGGGGLGHE